MTLCEGRGKMAAQRNTRSLCLFESEEICVCKVARTVVNIAVPFVTMIRKRFQPFLMFRQLLAVVRQWRLCSSCPRTSWGGRAYEVLKELYFFVWIYLFTVKQL